VGSDDEFERALKLLAENGWVVRRSTGRGYIEVACGCGDHLGRLHKTPSNPRHFREKAAFLVRQCSTRPGRVP
jgi:hypothetical protein